MQEPLFGFDRRRFLRASAAGVVAATVPFADRIRAGESQEPGAGKAKSVMIVLLSGGPSQLDMCEVTGTHTFDRGTCKAGWVRLGLAALTILRVIMGRAERWLGWQEWRLSRQMKLRLSM